MVEKENGDYQAEFRKGRSLEDQNICANKNCKQIVMNMKKKHIYCFWILNIQIEARATRYKKKVTSIDNTNFR